MERYDDHPTPGSLSCRPDLEQLCWGPSHQAAWEALMSVIHERKGGVTILGEAGLGKTTLMRAFMASMDQQYFKTIYISDATITFPSLLKTIYHEFSLDVQSDFLSDMLSHLHQIFIDEYKAHRNVVLILDNAHNFSTATLANLRFLTLLKLSEVHLIQLVLLGQPALAQRLNQGALQPLKRHLAVCLTLGHPGKDKQRPPVHQRVARLARHNTSRIMSTVLLPLVRHVRGIPHTLHRLYVNTCIVARSIHAKLLSCPIARHARADAGEQRSFWEMPWAWAGFVELQRRTEAAIAVGLSRCQRALQHMIQYARGGCMHLLRRCMAVGKAGLLCGANLLAYTPGKIGMANQGDLQPSRGLPWALAGAVGFVLVGSLLWYFPRPSQDPQPSDVTVTAAWWTPLVLPASEPAVPEASAPAQTATAAEARLAVAQLRARFGHRVTTPTAVGGDEHVRQLQARLQAAGFAAGPIDGVLGPQTQHALRQFQKANGLDATGEPSAPTRKALGL